MSRIGRAPVLIPSSVKVHASGATVACESAKGKLSFTLPAELSATVKDGHLQIQRANDLKATRALHGLYRALVANAVKGLTDGFQRELEVTGVGYRAQAKGNAVNLYVGFSHPVVITIPQGITVETPKPTTVLVKGSDRAVVGQVAANIRAVAPAEPYKGKGIRYAEEVIRRKAGKAATGAKGATTK
jgi:large subunit ribosomal protein L6